MTKENEKKEDDKDIKENPEVSGSKCVSSDIYHVLDKEALDEKVKVNLDNGFTLETLKKQILNEKYELNKSRLRQQTHLVNLEIMIQNYEEVITYIEELMSKEGNDGS